MRDRRVKITTKSHIVGGTDKVYDFRINAAHILVREIGRRDSDVLIPWERVIATALIFSTTPEPIERVGEAKSMTIELKSLDPALGTAVFSAILTSKGMGIRRSEEAPGWHRLAWTSIVNLAIRHKWGT